MSVIHTILPNTAKAIFLLMFYREGTLILGPKMDQKQQ
jgi:hypothetical protein